MGTSYCSISSFLTQPFEQEHAHCLDLLDTEMDHTIVLANGIRFLWLLSDALTEGKSEIVKKILQCSTLIKAFASFVNQNAISNIILKLDLTCLQNEEYAFMTLYNTRFGFRKQNIINAFRTVWDNNESVVFSRRKRFWEISVREYHYQCICEERTKAALSKYTVSNAQIRLLMRLVSNTGLKKYLKSDSTFNYFDFSTGFTGHQYGWKRWFNRVRKFMVSVTCI